jgi:hypothetical protein
MPARRDMPIELEKDALEIACQQVLLSNASVYSVQWLDLPARHAPQVTASLLLERYFRAVRTFTCHLIRPTVTDEGVQFRVWATPLVLLSFSLPELNAEAFGESVQLRIRGGFLVQDGGCRDGIFSLVSAPHGAAVRIRVQLSGYYPLLLGSPRPSRARKLLYRITQAYIHKALTVRYLSCLHSELTGTKIRASVKKVQVREGTET